MSVYHLTIYYLMYLKFLYKPPKQYNNFKWFLRKHTFFFFFKKFCSFKISVVYACVYATVLSRAGILTEYDVVVSSWVSPSYFWRQGLTKPGAHSPARQV